MKRKKCAYGASSIRNVMDTPNEVLGKNELNKAKAQADAMDNPFAAGLDILSQLLLTATFGPSVGSIPLAFGSSSVGDVPVEVEGGEVARTPEGDTIKFKGKKHEQGGIEGTLPEYTQVFSDRLKKGEISFAKEEEKRAKELASLDKRIEKNPYDMMLRETKKIVENRHEKERQESLALQETLKSLAINIGEAEKVLQGARQKLSEGTPSLKYLSDLENPTEGTPYLKYFSDLESPVGFLDMPYPNLLGKQSPSLSVPTMSDIKAQPSSVEVPIKGKGVLGNFMTSLEGKAPQIASIPAGDYLGLLGTAYASVAPLLETQKNRATDTPNIDYAKNYGRDSLAKLGEMKQELSGYQTLAEKKLAEKESAARDRLRNSARGINTLRALDTAVNVQTNRALDDLYLGMAEQTMGILGREANMLEKIDAVTAESATQRDIADKMDKDLYHTQLAKDKVSIGEGLQQMGRNLNLIKYRNDMEKLTEQYNQNLLTYDQYVAAIGEILAAQGIPTSVPEQNKGE